MNHGQGDSADPLLTSLPLSDPRCRNDSCLAFEAAHNRSQKEVSYYYQFEYGHWTTWLYVILVFIFTLAHGFRLWHNRRPRSNTMARKPLRALRLKAIAAARYFSYQRLSGKLFDWLGLPSYGLLAAFLLLALFLAVLTFAVRPYYRQFRGFGSPPLAIRTGLMAIACTPILLALSGKANIITVLTGVGHEKLNVIHRWVAWMCFALSLVHTIPFIVAPLRDGGYRALHEQFYSPGGFEYTGVPPLAMLFGLVVLSIPYLRHRFYEAFYHLHILLAISYVGLMFWHSGNLGDSWAYLWATIAVWLASILARFFYFNQSLNVHNQWIVGSPTHLQALPGNMTRIDVLAPHGFSWRPGQHCFLRFPSLSIFDNHPFTIANSCTASKPTVKTGNHDRDPRSMTFFVRSHTGFTQKLSRYIKNHADISASAWIDGPYGGILYKVENAFDSIILVAGGAGITACLAWLQHIAWSMKFEVVRTRRVSLIWAVHEAEHLDWVSTELREIASAGSSGNIDMSFYVTGPVSDSTSHSQLSRTEEMDQEMKIHADEDGCKHASTGTESRSFGIHHRGRPLLADLMPSMLTSPRSLVIGCGPESLKIDLSNACARAQTKVLKGEVEEIGLWTESFGW